MAETYSAKRMLRILPSQFKVTSFPSVSFDFYDAYHSSIFRPRLYDSIQTVFTTEEGNDIDLKRDADGVKESIYVKALQVDDSTGTVFDHGLDVDDELGSSWSITFCVQLIDTAQPDSASYFHPFHAGSGSPRFGYREDTGKVNVQDWVGQSTGDTITFDHDAGWQGGDLFACTLVSDADADETYLYVNGEKVHTETEAVEVGSSTNMDFERGAVASNTSLVNLEAFFAHDNVLSSDQVSELHSLFTTGLTEESRWVRTFMAFAMMFGRLEDLLWDFVTYRNIENAEGGALVKLGQDFGVEKKPGESDGDLRQRIKNRLLELFSDGTLNQLINVSAGRTGLTDSEITVLQNRDNKGNDQHASFVVKLPPGNEGKLSDLDSGLDAAKVAGVKHYAGTKGDFAWGEANQGWDEGAWTYTR